jgi:hypothetical protein
MSDIRQANGLVAALQQPLIDNRAKIGLTVAAHEIGNAKGQADDLFEKGTRRAVEQLVLLAQVHAKTPTENITRELTDKNIQLIANYLDARKVSDTDQNKIITSIHALKDDKNAQGVSLLDQVYTQYKGQTNIAALKVPTGDEATQVAAAPNKGKQIILNNDFSYSVKPHVITMHSFEYDILLAAGDAKNQSFKPRMDAYEEGLARRLKTEMQYAGIDTQSVNILELTKAGLKGKLPEGTDPRVMTMLENVKQQPVTFAISKADHRNEDPLAIRGEALTRDFKPQYNTAVAALGKPS